MSSISGFTFILGRHDVVSISVYNGEVKLTLNCGSELFLDLSTIDDINKEINSVRNES